MGLVQATVASPSRHEPRPRNGPAGYLIRQPPNFLIWSSGTRIHGAGGRTPTNSLTVAAGASAFPFGTLRYPSGLPRPPVGVSTSRGRRRACKNTQFYCVMQQLPKHHHQSAAPRAPIGRREAVRSHHKTRDSVNRGTIGNARANIIVKKVFTLLIFSASLPASAPSLLASQFGRSTCACVGTALQSSCSGR